MSFYSSLLQINSASHMKIIDLDDLTNKEIDLTDKVDWLEVSEQNVKTGYETSKIEFKNESGLDGPRLVSNLDNSLGASNGILFHQHSEIDVYQLQLTNEERKNR